MAEIGLVSVEATVVAPDSLEVWQRTTTRYQIDVTHEGHKLSVTEKFATADLAYARALDLLAALKLGAAS